MTKSRNDGEGSAYQLSDGRWRAEVTIGWETGANGRRTRKRRYVYGKTKPEANRARRDLLAKRDKGELALGDGATLASWLRYYLDEVAIHRVRPSTWSRYDDLCRNWIFPVIGDVRLRDLAPEHLDLLQARMREGRERRIVLKNGDVKVIAARPLSASTRLQAHRVLSRALKVALQRGKVGRVVTTLVDAPSLARSRAEQYLLPDEARAFLRACEGRWNGARWSVALALGLRQGEALGLLWDTDVDLDAGTLTVQRQLQRHRPRTLADGTVIPGAMELVPSKSANSNRTIQLPPPLVAVLRAHRREAQKMRMAIGPDWAGSDLGDLVFTTKQGRPIQASNDWHEWREILTEIGVKPMRQHASRHTAATLMLAQGTAPKVVSAILGHGTIQITQDLYQHVLPELSEEAAQRMGQMLWG